MRSRQAFEESIFFLGFICINKYKILFLRVVNKTIYKRSEDEKDNRID